MTPEQNIYDFENNLPYVFCAALVDRKLNAVTATSEPQFQEKTPRSELIFKPGAAVTPARIALAPDGTRTISAYKGDLSVKVVTMSNDTAKQNHSEYRASVRAAFELDVIRKAFNQIPSVYCLQFMLPVGSSQTLKYQDGNEVTDLTYSVDFSIQADAWAQLNL